MLLVCSIIQGLEIVAFGRSRTCTIIGELRRKVLNQAAGGLWFGIFGIPKL